MWTFVTRNMEWERKHKSSIVTKSVSNDPSCLASASWHVIVLQKVYLYQNVQISIHSYIPLTKQWKKKTNKKVLIPILIFTCHTNTIWSWYFTLRYSKYRFYSSKLNILLQINAYTNKYILLYISFKYSPHYPFIHFLI